MLRLVLSIAFSVALIFSVQPFLPVASFTPDTNQDGDTSHFTYLDEANSGLQDLIPAKVIAIIDGDTLRLSTDSHTFIANLAFIDAPEKEQPFGREASTHLKKLLLNHSVLIQPEDDAWVMYRRGENVNLTQLQKGFAWLSQPLMKSVEKTTATEAKTPLNKYIYAYQTASENLQGLWALEHDLRVSPWQWRKQTVEISPRKEYKFSLANPFLQKPQHEQQKHQHERERVLREIAIQRTMQEKRQSAEINRLKPPSHVTTKPNEPSINDQNH